MRESNNADLATIKETIDTMQLGDYDNAAYLVIEYGDDPNASDLQKLVNQLAQLGYYPAIDTALGLLMRWMPPKFEEPKVEPDVCTVWGGPLTGQTIPMRAAMACWGEGLLNKPTSGVANAQASGRKADEEAWNLVIRSVWNEPLESAGEDDVEFMDDKEADDKEADDDPKVQTASVAVTREDVAAADASNT